MCYDYCYKILSIFKSAYNYTVFKADYNAL